MSSVSDIKLIRTDTTLDLSQKAEKVCVVSRATGPFRVPSARRGAAWANRAPVCATCTKPSCKKNAKNAFFAFCAWAWCRAHTLPAGSPLAAVRWPGHAKSTLPCCRVLQLTVLCKDHFWSIVNHTNP